MKLSTILFTHIAVIRAWPEYTARDLMCLGPQLLRLSGCVVVNVRGRAICVNNCNSRPWLGILGVQDTDHDGT